MSTTTIIPQTNNAYISQSFTSAGKNNIGLCCNVLQSSETMTIQVYDFANAVWKNASDKNGNLFLLTATANFLTIFDDAQTYRVVKTATVALAGLATVSDIKLMGFL
jgi:hypothetical protein